MSRLREQQHSSSGQSLKMPYLAHSLTNDNTIIDEGANSSSSEDIIHCVCDDSSDDGFMIQCESCEEWQHGHCVNVRKSNVPKHYYCYRCSRNDDHNSRQKRHKGLSNGGHTVESKGKKRHKKYIKDSSLDSKRSKNYNSSDDSNSEEDDRHDHTTNNDSNQMPSTAAKRKKKFAHLRNSIFKDKLVEDILMEVHRQWMELNRQPKGDTTRSFPTKGLNSIVVMESNLLQPAIPKASVRPLRKSLRGSYFQQHKQTNHQALVAKGIFADIHIPEKRYLMEVTGELMRKSKYKKDVKNRYDLLGVPLPRVFFYQALDICIDARFAGNESRYIRRSCCPNSEVKSIILPNDSDDRTIHMGIYTSEEVDRGEEITIGWNWHKGVLMWQKNKEFLRRNHKVNIDKSERKTIKKILDLIEGEFGECACEDKDECLIESLKDQLEEFEEDTDNLDEAEEVKVVAKKERRKKPPTHVLDAPKSLQQKSTKRTLKKATPPIIRKSSTKPVKTNTTIEKEVRVTGIFSSDDELDTGVSTATTAVITTSISMDATMDDIISSSPLTSLSQSGSDVDVKEEMVSELNASTTISQTDKARLPTKKRWLLQYIAEQRKAKASSLQKQHLNDVRNDIPPQISQRQTDMTIIPPAEIGNTIMSDVGELSDGTSSESTLPLEDTPTTRQLDFETKQPHIAANKTTATTATIPPASASNVNTTTHVTSLMTTTTDSTTTLDTSGPLQQDSVVPESVSIAMGDPKHVLSHEQNSTTASPAVKQTPRKLTLQEYLSMRQSKHSTATSSISEKQSSTED